MKISIGHAAIAATLSLTLAGAPRANAQTTIQATGHEHDWDWLVGKWDVQHNYLKGRLDGSKTWEHFTGTSTLWLTLGGLGTIDDNVLNRPGGTYKAVGVRAFDAKTGKWAIWWLDGRNPDHIDPPVYGGFKDGVGEFTGDDTLNGKPIVVRYRWTDITANSAHWEQAFSPDGGKTWEVNWKMDFTRAK